MSTATGVTVPGAKTHAPSQAMIDGLFRRWQQHHDASARDQLVRHYLPLAGRLARRYRGSQEPFDDLKQVASLGLVKAIDGYDPDRGTSFQAFAVPTILGELKRYFRDCCWAVHMPRGIQELALKVEQAKRTLTAQTGREATYRQLAEYLEIELEDVLDAVEASAAHHSVSFDRPHETSDGEVKTLGDSIGEPDQRFELVEFGAAIETAARNLSERDRRVLALRFLADHTQTQIAEQVGVSQMQVSRILRRSLKELSEAVDAPEGRA